MLTRHDPASEPRAHGGTGVQRDQHSSRNRSRIRDHPHDVHRHQHRDRTQRIAIQDRLEQACDDEAMPAKFCLGCGELTRNGSRCEECTEEWTARRNARPKANTTKRGLGHAHRMRAQAVVAAAQVCAECGQPPTKEDPLTADHTIPRSQGGADSPLRAVHRSCNSRAGGRLPRSKQ